MGRRTGTWLQRLSVPIGAALLLGLAATAFASQAETLAMPLGTGTPTNFAGRAVWDSVRSAPAAPAAVIYFDIAIDESRSLLYGSDRVGGKIDVISMATLQVVNSVNIGLEPVGLDIRADDNELAVALYGQAEVAFVDLSTLTVSDRVVPAGTSGPNQPYDVLYGRTGRLYSVGNPGSGGVDFVHVFDTATKAELGKSPQIMRAAPRLAMTADFNTLYVSQVIFIPQKIYRFDITTDTPTQTAAAPHGPVQVNTMAVMPDGSKVFSSRGQIWSGDLATQLGSFSPISQEIEYIGAHGVFAVSSGTQITYIDANTYSVAANSPLLGTAGVARATSDGSKLYVSTDAGVNEISLSPFPPPTPTPTPIPTPTPTPTPAPPPIVKDGGFEQGSPNPVWNEFSSNFGTPLCTTEDCGFGGGAGPHGGNWWAWFGGLDVPEIGSVTQEVIIPAGTSELSFWLEIPIGSGTGGDFLQVSIDSNLLFEVTDAATGLYPTYTKIALDVSSFGNCAAHNLSFYSETSGVGLSNFFVDDVVLELVEPARFCDVPTAHWAWNYIEAIFDAGLTVGYPDGTYRPDNPVTRAEMAVFLKKGIHGSTYTPPAPEGSHPFSDIAGHWAEAWIEDLYDEGFTSGFPDGTYRPENRVTRAEMAVFLKKAIHGSAYTSPTPDGSHPFGDIGGHWAEAWIEDLYDEGITSGYPDGTYRPENQVTRAEMAVFLVNAFSLPLP